jgi:hypothetical protein
MRIHTRVKRCLLLFLVLTLLACLHLAAGCDNSSTTPYGNSANGSVSGTVVGVDPSGAEVSLLNSSGEELARSEVSLSSDGVYHLPLNAPMPDSEYLIAQVTRNGRSLRALVTGFSTGSDYEGNDTIISPDTEAAVRLSSLGHDMSLYDYALFLRSCVDGRFELDLPNSYGFPYREMIGGLSEAVAAYFNGGMEFLPGEDQIDQMIVSSNHPLGVSLPASIPSDSHVRRAIMTPDGSAQLIIGYDPKTSILAAAPIQVTASSHEDGSFQWNAYQVDLGSNILKSADLRIIEKHPVGAAAVMRFSPSGPGPQTARADSVHVDSRGGSFVLGKGGSQMALTSHGNHGVVIVGELGHRYVAMLGYNVNQPSELDGKVFLVDNVLSGESDQEDAVGTCTWDGHQSSIILTEHSSQIILSGPLGLKPIFWIGPTQML